MRFKVNCTIENKEEMITKGAILLLDFDESELDECSNIYSETCRDKIRKIINTDTKFQGYKLLNYEEIELYQYNPFDFIDKFYAEHIKVKQDILKLRMKLNKDFVNDYIHLFAEYNYRVEELYAHDFEQPEFEGLEESYFNALDGLCRFYNYLDLILTKDQMEDEIVIGDLYMLLFHLKNQYHGIIKGKTIEELEEICYTDEFVYE